MHKIFKNLYKMKKSSGLLWKKWYSIKKSDIYYEEVFLILIQD